MPKEPRSNLAPCFNQLQLIYLLFHGKNKNQQPHHHLDPGFTLYRNAVCHRPISTGLCAIASDFKTNTATISLSVSSYFIGMAIGQILYGPFLDRYGRKRPLYVGLLIFILASLGCMQKPGMLTR